MFISETDIEVRYAETDQMGIVYYANYFTWFDIGRTKLVKDLGFRYTEMEKDGYLAPVLDAQANFKKSVLYGGYAKVRIWIEEYDGIKTVYGYEILDEQGNICVTGSSSHILVKKGSFRPVAMKKVFPDWHEIYEKERKVQA